LTFGSIRRDRCGDCLRYQLSTINCLSELIVADERFPVVIPFRELSPEALRGVIESFVLREGTDYGELEYTLDEKVAHVMRQLERGEARIEFDPNTETVDIVRVK
jgi:uncharacterized protein YheU (UPF0270 family)